MLFIYLFLFYLIIFLSVQEFLYDWRHNIVTSTNVQYLIYFAQTSYIKQIYVSSDNSNF